jgi:hypothetical protein
MTLYGATAISIRACEETRTLFASIVYRERPRVLVIGVSVGGLCPDHTVRTGRKNRQILIYGV